MKKSFAEILKALPSYSETRKFESSYDKQKFDVEHLDAAKSFLEEVDPKCRDKIKIVIDDAKESTDPRFFKKLTDIIWEFRVNHRGMQYRLLAFWERKDVRPLVLTTHGFVKKTQKVPGTELHRAEKIRSRYLLKIK